MIRIVLMGYGPVGARFAEGMLESVRVGRVTLTVIGAEDSDVYNRVLIGEYAVGRVDRDTLDISDTDEAIAAGVSVRLSEACVFVDRQLCQVHTSSGSSIPYDRLVFATGARSNIPRLDGLERARRDRLAPPSSTPEGLDRGQAPLPTGVTTLRDLRDAETVAEAVQNERRIVVLGAGVLGMEFALAAAEGGADVSVVHHSAAPMPRNLDVAGGRTLALAAAAAGVKMIAHSRAESVLTREDEHGFPHFDALVCADGKQIRGDHLVLSAGATPRVELAAQAGLTVSTGIVVDSGLRSWDDPRLFAIGDCAQVAERDNVDAHGRIPGAPQGLVGPGWRQADALAEYFTAEAAGRMGVRAAPSRGPRSVVMLKAEGVDVCAAGVVDAEPWDSHDPGTDPELARQVTLWSDPARRAYLKLVSRGPVIEGFVCVGLPRAAAELTLLYERGGELPGERSGLLLLDSVEERPVTSDPFAPDRTVCWCNGVTAGRITEVIAGGEDSLECVARSTRAGTGCGGCKGRITELLARAAPAPAR